MKYKSLQIDGTAEKGNPKYKVYASLKLTGTSLVVQWLRLCAPNAGGPGSIPGQGTGSCMQQLKDPACRS